MLGMPLSDNRPSGPTAELVSSESRHPLGDADIFVQPADVIDPLARRSRRTLMRP
jgi:hypothetical protein